MKIYTKTGDDGKTALFGGARLFKDDIKIEAYGTVDELNALIGIVYDSIENSVVLDQLRNIQNDLFNWGAILATQSGKSTFIKAPGAESITLLENWIDEMENKLNPLKNFILPSGYLNSSYIHLARTVCRRAERRIVALHKIEEQDTYVLLYFNRLSDYLFVLARFIMKLGEKQEVNWIPERKPK